MNDEKKPPPCVIYAALSVKKRKHDTDDRRDEESVESQVEKVRRRLADVYNEDVAAAAAVFDQDVGYSGSKGDRGPDLKRAIAAATEAAAEHEQAELWAVVSTRFARGMGGLKGARRLSALWNDLDRVGVKLRSVEDDLYLTEEFVGIASKMAAKYSADLKETVTRSKRRQAERGERLGGPVPLGYRKPGEETARVPLVPDPDTAPLVRRIFELAAQGVPDAAAARMVNAEGHRTRSGQPFTRRQVQWMVCNAFYSGRIAYDGEMFPGQHDGLIEPRDFDRIQEQRTGRDLGSGQHTPGKPARLHLLARLAVCGCCGAPMFAYTAPYRRKSDGLKARKYRCREYHHATGACSMPAVDAEAIDTAVMRSLDTLVPDFGQWAEAIEDRHAAERKRLAERVTDAEADRDRARDDLERQRRKYRAARDDLADLALEFVREAEADLAAAETRVQATSDALASVPVEAPRDRLLDFAIDLREAVRGNAQKAHSVEDVNRLLIETFDRFVVWAPGSPLPADTQADPHHGFAAGQIAVEPVLRLEVVEKLMQGNPFEAWGTPPMQWVEAVWPLDSLTTPRHTCG